MHKVRAMVAAIVHPLGTCTYERSDLFMVTLLDLWIDAAQQFEKICSLTPTATPT